MKALPYVCPVCRTTEDYYGILVFPDDEGNVAVPTCPNHKGSDGVDPKVELVPA
jgi:hypothetical protein